MDDLSICRQCPLDDELMAQLDHANQLLLSVNELAIDSELTDHDVRVRIQELLESL